MCVCTRVNNYSYDIHGSFDQLAAVGFRFILTSIESPKIELMITAFIHKKSLMLLPYVTNLLFGTLSSVLPFAPPAFSVQIEKVKVQIVS